MDNTVQIKMIGSAANHLLAELRYRSMRMSSCSMAQLDSFSKMRTRLSVLKYIAESTPDRILEISDKLYFPMAILIGEMINEFAICKEYINGNILVLPEVRTPYHLTRYLGEMNEPLPECATQYISLSDGWSALYNP